MKTRFIIVAASLSFCCVQKGFAQDQFQKVYHALQQYAKNNNEERVYLLPAKTVYTSGETAPFTVFVTASNKPSGSSKIVYAELLNSQGVILTRLTLPLNNGSGYGSFSLPAALQAGDYYIRSYTLWMLNFDSSIMALRHIAVINNGTAIKNNKDAQDFIAEFYPEGGNLVDGLTSRVAFKVTGADGHPVEATGRITDSSGRVWANISTTHNGIGSFMIHMPVYSTVYKADITSINGIHKTFTLPAAAKSGVVLYLQKDTADKENAIHFRVSRSTVDKKLYQHLFLCTQAGSYFTFDAIDFDERNAGNLYDTILKAPSPISLDNMPGGVLHVTLFNALDGKIMAERLIYNDTRKTVVSPVISSNAGIGNMDTVELKTPAGFTGDYTVTVSHAGDEDLAGDENLASGIILSGIKKEVYNAAWYFNGNLDEKAKALDNLLLTCTPAYNWQTVLAAPGRKEKYFAEQTLSLAGYAYEVKGKERTVMHTGKFNIILDDAKDSTKDLYNVPVNQDGYFEIPNLTYHDTALIYVQAAGKNHNIAVEFEKHPLDSIRLAAIPQKKYYYNVAPGDTVAAVAITKSNAGIIDTTKYHELKRVTVTSSVKAKSHLDSIVSSYATGPFATDNGKTYNLLDEKAGDKYSENIIQWLQANVAGIIIEGNTSNTGASLYKESGMPVIYWRLQFGIFTAGNMKMKNTPAFFLNEQPLEYGDAVAMFIDLKIADVALVKIFQPGTFPLVSGNSPNGAVVVYTKNGSELQFEKTPSYFNKIKKAGYSIQPVLPVKNAGDIVYWQPNINADSTGNSYKFTVNKSKHPLKIRVEGLGKDGRLMALDETIP